MKTVRLMILSACLLNFTACMPWVRVETKEETKAPANSAPVATPEAKPLVSACDLMKNQYKETANLEMEDVKTVKIHRQNRLVVQKNCQGQVSGKYVESVRPPHASVALKPKNDLGVVKAVEYINFQTCYSGGLKLPLYSVPLLAVHPVTGKDNGQLSLDLDMAEGWFRTRVNKGLNEIYYTYYRDCLESNANRKYSTGPTCVNAQVVQSGVFRVFVDYTEETLPTRVAEANVEECSRQK